MITRFFTTLARQDLAQMMVKAASVLGVRIMGSALTFGFSVAVARSLGAEQSGYFFLALSVVMIWAVIARVGFEGVALRFVAAEIAGADLARVRAVLRNIARFVGLASVGVCAALMLGADAIAQHVFAKPAVAGPLFWLAGVVVALNLMRIAAAALRAMDRQALSELVGSGIQPSLVLLGMAAFWGRLGVVDLAQAYALSTVATAMIGWVLLRRSLIRHPQPSAPPASARGARPTLRELLPSALPLWVANVINLALLPWLPLVVLGAFASAQDVGIFAVCVRIANLIGVFMAAVISVPAPRFARLERAGQRHDIARLSRNFAAVVTMAVLPVVGVLTLYGDWVLALLGAEFSQGARVLTILVLGQFSVVWVGPVRMVLIMTGQERQLRNAAIASVVVLALLLVVLVPLWGAMGAAIAAAISTWVASFLPVPSVLRSCGEMPVPGLHLLPWWSQKRERG